MGRTVCQQTGQARRLLDDPDTVCQRIGQGALMPRGHIARQRGGRRRVLSAIKCGGCTAVWALCQAWPVGLCHGPQATRQQWVSAWVGSVGRGLDTRRLRTPTHTGVFLILGPRQGLVRTWRDLEPTRGTRHALLGAPDPSIQGSGVPWGSRAIDASRDVLSFLATWCSYACPCGGRCSPYDLGVSHGCNTFIP
jgi:hypothetical protein